MTALQPVRIGTRRSRLALAQAAIAMEALEPLIGPTEIVEIGTRGDAISARRPGGGWAAGDGQFVRELERALIDHEVDVVVHSYKDLPTLPVEGLVIAAVLTRADPRDCLLSADGAGLEELPFCARVGTSSPRRAAQLAARRSDLIALPMRGNVESRLQRLEGGVYDAIILAAAGLDRLGVEVPAAARLPLEVMLPAPAQGALALQVRSSDAPLRELMGAIDHRPTRIAVEAERALLRRVGGGCLAPLGALAQVDGPKLRLRAAYEHPDGDFVRVEATGVPEEADRVVADVENRISVALATS